MQVLSGAIASPDEMNGRGPRFKNHATWVTGGRTRIPEGEFPARIEAPETARIRPGLLPISRLLTSSRGPRYGGSERMTRQPEVGSHRTGRRGRIWTIPAESCRPVAAGNGCPTPGSHGLTCPSAIPGRALASGPVGSAGSGSSGSPVSKALLLPTPTSGNMPEPGRRETAHIHRFPHSHSGSRHGHTGSASYGRLRSL